MNARRLREKKGLTQTELSEKVKISQSEISAIECGKVPFNVKTAKIYGKYFGVDWKELLK